MTTGSDLGALGVRTNRATLVETTPSRVRNLNNERTEASLRRMLTAVNRCSYRYPSHSRIASASISSTVGGLSSIVK